MIPINRVTEPHFNRTQLEINTITQEIIGCGFKVSNTLGVGFLEKVYENALAHEIRKAGFAVAQQHPIQVYYDRIVVGEYVADLLVEGLVIVELKAIKQLTVIEDAQCLNYIRATNVPICLLLNFGKPKMGIERFVHPLWSTLPTK
ncbi:MAG: GxxExxY protein [Ardenticatenaceae bacterium]|nr:GxxExxY protein [Ardenticatenaceae bacterium]